MDIVGRAGDGDHAGIKSSGYEPDQLQPLMPSLHKMTDCDLELRVVGEAEMSEEVKLPK